MAEEEGKRFVKRLKKGEDSQGLREGDMSDEVLATLPVKDLNNLLRGMPEDDVYKLKQRRRTLKNRGYAQNSRTKRVRQREDLECERKQLKDELYVISKENEDLRRERDEAKRKYDSLQKLLTNRTKQIGGKSWSASVVCKDGTTDHEDQIDVVGIEDGERLNRASREPGNDSHSFENRKRERDIRMEDGSDESR